MKILYFFLVFVWMKGAFAATTPSLNPIKIVYSVSGGVDPKDAATMDWNPHTKECRLTLPNARKARTIDFKKCETLLSEVVKHQNEFMTQLKTHKSVQATHLTRGAHIPLAQLEMNGVKVAVRKNKATWCDENNTHCAPDSFDPVDELGERIRVFLDQQINLRN